MLKKLSLATSVLMALAVVAWACPPGEESSAAKAGTVAQKSGGCCGKGSAAAKEGCAKSCCTKGSGVVLKVMESLPHMTFQVGEKQTGCPKEAAELAKANDAKIVYLVADSKFDSKDEALAKLASVLDSTAQEMLTISYSVDGECTRCPMQASATAQAKKSTMKYRVAGIDFSSQEQAQAAIDKAKDAIAKVTMTIKAGDAERTVTKLDSDSTPCSKMKATFSVNGEETECPVQAKLMLAQAKIRAMIEAAATLAS